MRFKLSIAAGLLGLLALSVGATFEAAAKPPKHTPPTPTARGAIGGSVQLNADHFCVSHQSSDFDCDLPDPGYPVHGSKGGIRVRLGDRVRVNFKVPVRGMAAQADCGLTGPIQKVDGAGGKAWSFAAPVPATAGAPSCNEVYIDARYSDAGRYKHTIGSYGVTLQAHITDQRCDGKPATTLGTPERDVFRASRASDVIVARGGNDYVIGLGGNDLVCGDDGDDKLFGQRGNDTLIGGQGNDRLIGGKGRDRCRGGKSANDGPIGDLARQCERVTGGGRSR